MFVNCSVTSYYNVLESSILGQSSIIHFVHTWMIEMFTCLQINYFFC
jgi:hypothetical protein